MAYSFIRVEQKKHLTLVTINRPEVLNALHPPACHELDDAFNKFAEDPATWVAIITGAGEKAFCVGNDLKWHSEHGNEALRKGLDSLQGGWGGITKRFDCHKPLIAAVNGLALGGGFELALACDIIIAAQNARFALPEPRVGMMAAAGGVNRLPRQIPYHVAMGLILTGRSLPAQKAFRLGVVNEVVAQADLMNTTERWAADLMECAPLALRAAKEAVVKGLELPYQESIGKLYPGFVAMRQSEDYVEGPRAFAAKRKPVWKGR